MRNFAFRGSNSKNRFLNLGISDKFIILMSILNPFIYLISPILLLISIVIEMIFIFAEQEEFYKKFWKAFLIAITYYGVGIVHVKIYYWVFILSLPYIIFIQRNKLNKRRIYFLGATAIFALYLTFDLFIHKIKGYTVSEYLRYIMCFIVLYITLKTIRNIDEVKGLFKSIRVVSLANIISGLIILVFAMKNITLFKPEVHHKLYFVSIYYSHDRVAAFFSDPNLYFAFFTFLLAIYEFIQFTTSREKIKMFDITNILLLIAMLISLSRTGIIVVVLYVIAKFIAVKILQANYRANAIFWYILTIIAIIAFLIFKTPILNFCNYVLYHLTILIGRKSALVYSSSFTNSSRVISWKVALHSLNGHWILGRGFNFWQTIYYMPPHNSFIMMAQDSGIIGLLFLLGLMIYSMRRIPLYIILLPILITMATLDLQNFIMLFVLIGVGVIYIDDMKKGFNRN